VREHVKEALQEKAEGKTESRLSAIRGCLMQTSMNQAKGNRLNSSKEEHE